MVHSYGAWHLCYYGLVEKWALWCSGALWLNKKINAMNNRAPEHQRRFSAFAISRQSHYDSFEYLNTNVCECFSVKSLEYCGGSLSKVALHHYLLGHIVGYGSKKRLLLLPILPTVASSRASSRFSKILLIPKGTSRTNLPSPFP